MAAGAATKNGNVGFIVPFPIPEIIRHTNGFALGVLAVRPDAKIRLVWTKSWFDPAKERKAAESLVAAGVDVIGQNVDSLSAGQYAQTKGIPWVGLVEREEVRADLLAHVRVVRLGSLLPQARQGGPERHLEDRELLGKHGRRLRGARSFGPKVSAKTRAAINARKKAIISGKFYEFTGPAATRRASSVPKGKRTTLPRSSR